MQTKLSIGERVINKIRKLTNPGKQFYVDLFINNKEWNTEKPNGEERMRWEIIERYMERIVQSSIEYRSKAGFILDVGCGRGWLTNLLSRYGIVKGIEPVGPVVKHANKLFPELDISKGTTKSIIDTHQRKFDVIVSSEVIEHIPDSLKKDFANDLTLLSKDNGYLIITTPRKEAQREWMKYQIPGQPVEEWMDEKEVENLFVSFGWKVLLKNRFSLPPSLNAPEVEIYQLWLFSKIN